MLRQKNPAIKFKLLRASGFKPGSHLKLTMKKLCNIYLFVFIFLGSFTSGAQPKYGQYAYEISLPSATGDTLKLSSLKGKVVLLDFWASWCSPCRASNRRLIKIYPKYKDKGFEVFSVSIDDNKKDWKRAIEKDKITWKTVIDPGGWSAPIVAQWKVDAIPTSFLIDKTGKLVAMDLEGKELEKSLKELLGD